MKKKTFLLLLILPVLAILVLYLTSLKKETANSCGAADLSGKYNEEELTAFYNGEQVDVPSLAQGKEVDNVLGVSGYDDKWIEVDLSEQTLTAWQNDQIFLQTPVSTGLPWWPTPTGEFRIWIKLRYTKMEGGEGKYYYYLPNVPFTMFFENSNYPGYLGYGLHGTYWHNDFGTQRSHGCVNLPTSVAERLYYWVAPVGSGSEWTTYSTDTNIGTKIVIHE